MGQLPSKKPLEDDEAVQLFKIFIERLKTDDVYEKRVRDLLETTFKFCSMKMKGTPEEVEFAIRNMKMMGNSEEGMDRLKDAINGGEAALEILRSRLHDLRTKHPTNRSQIHAMESEIEQQNALAILRLDLLHAKYELSDRKVKEAQLENKIREMKKQYEMMEYNKDLDIEHLQRKIDELEDGKSNKKEVKEEEEESEMEKLKREIDMDKIEPIVLRSFEGPVPLLTYSTPQKPPTIAIDPSEVKKYVAESNKKTLQLVDEIRREAVREIENLRRELEEKTRKLEKFEAVAEIIQEINES
uniref:Uncharacterized protein n=1 Tax=Caenorhabditis tropicalis TaxID=1561998 RepID=A0A1I7TPL0_9PELO